MSFLSTFLVPRSFSWKTRGSAPLRLCVDAAFSRFILWRYGRTILSACRDCGRRACGRTIAATGFEGRANVWLMRTGPPGCESLNQILRRRAGGCLAACGVGAKKPIPFASAALFRNWIRGGTSGPTRVAGAAFAEIIVLRPPQRRRARKTVVQPPRAVRRPDTLSG